MKLGRSSGSLLHLTSLPGKFGIGDMGPESRCFADLLSETQQKLWCVLPLGPTGPENSPYQSASAFAGDPLSISPEELVEHGYLAKKDLQRIFLPRAWNSRVFGSAKRRFCERLSGNSLRPKTMLSSRANTLGWAATHGSWLCARQTAVCRGRALTRK
jgi:4-alpha-glucanotransferase